MKNLGVGVMFGLLMGNEESVKAFKGGMEKEIVRLKMVEADDFQDGALVFGFADGTGIKLFDDGRSCCEERYMHTDDNLSDFIGSALLSAEVREAPDVQEEYHEHEVAFLLVKTTAGTFTVETHNEHNGYYGGFLVCCAELTPEELG